MDAQVDTGGEAEVRAGGEGGAVGMGEGGAEGVEEVDVRAECEAFAQWAGEGCSVVEQAGLGEGCALVPGGEGAEEGVAEQGDEAVALVVSGLEAEGGELGREACVQGIALVEGPEGAGLLPVEGAVGFGRYVLEPSGVGVPHGCEARGPVEQGLDGVGVDGVYFAAAVLCQHLEGQVEVDGCVGCVEAEAGREAYGEHLLVCVLSEDKALPVAPDVEGEVLPAEEELQPGFGVAGQVEFRVVERFYQLVVCAAVEVAHHEGEVVRQVGLRSEEGQDVAALLVLVAFPRGYVGVCDGWVLVCSVVEEEVSAQFHFEVFERLVGQFGLHPEAGQGIALLVVALVFVVFGEVEVVQLEGQLARSRGVQSVGCLVDEFGYLSPAVPGYVQAECEAEDAG